MGRPATDIGPDEMRISFIGSTPWPPRRDQAGTAITPRTDIVAIGAAGSLDPGALEEKFAACVDAANCEPGRG
jgi:hypothetical protein